MKLTKLEVYGFKSFADKLVIDFNDGITAIVGPNGCGKSNVCDAIRWILGEQSARQLRGKSMQDLIFGGTQSRRSMSYCEASLYFDNTSRLFPLEYDEVVISRKLYRTGESEYLVNRRPTRLRDISDMMRDVGLGRDGYSVVGQGRMDDILNAKPEDRRAIFEEALGISKFRARKSETERKLDRTNANMNRLRDIMSVLERQMGPLKKQSEDAKEFLILRDKLKYHEINSYLENYDNANENKKRFASKIEAVSEEIAYNESKYEGATARYDGLLSDIGEVDREIAELQGQATELKVTLERRAGEHNVLLERIRAFEKQIADYTNDIDSGKGRLADTERSALEATEKLLALTAEHEAVVKRLDSVNGELASLTHKLHERQDKMDAASKGVFGVLDSLTDRKSRLASLLSEKQTLNERLSAIEREENGRLEGLKSMGDSERQLANEYETAKAERDELDRQLNKLNGDIKRISDKLNKVNSQYTAAAQEQMRKRVSLEMLKNVAERYEGFSQAVKLLMTDLPHEREIKGRAIDVVANVLTVPDKYETAIEAALGGAVQNVITENEEDAKALIGYLKRRKYGRITFLPLNTVKPHSIPDMRALNERGVCGLAVDLVSFDKRYRPVADNLLGGTVVCEDMDVAVAVARKYGYSFRLVTLDGEIFSVQGSVTGGSRSESKYNVLSTERLIKETTAQLEAAADEASSLKKTGEELTAERTSLYAEYDKAHDESGALSVKIAAIEERIYGSSAAGRKERDDIERLNAEKTAVVARLKEIGSEYVFVKDAVEELTKRQADLGKGADSDKRLVMSLSAHREKLMEDGAGIRQDMARIAAEIEAFRLEKLRCEREMTVLTADIDGKRASVDNNKAALADCERELYSKSQSDGMVGELAVLEEAVKIKYELKEQMNAEFSSIDKERIAVNNEIMRLTQLKSREQFNLEKVDTDLEAMQQKILEDYKMTYSAALAVRDSEYKIAGSKREIARLRQDMSKLGDVNVSAIEQYREIKEEFDEDERQLKDLEKAESDLLGIIAQLTKEMVSRFNAGFFEISSNFSEIFKELFGGGKAEMCLEKTEGKEELDYGIEIEAQPPGKKLQNISLLSGGERALTCIAILFAILRLRPMPFCVLDEIEAPLDDSNAERVVRYLKKFAADTQFIVITHKKPTMENAGQLFGVTMQEKGVSRIVSVQLTEAVGHSA